MQENMQEQEKKSAGMFSALMKNKKLLAGACLAVVLVIVMLVVLISSLVEPKVDPDKKSTPEVLATMEKSQQAASEASSVHQSTQVALLLEAGEDQELEMSVRLDSYAIEGEPVQKQESVISLGGYGTQAITSYIDLENKLMYSTADSGLTWVKEELSDEEVTAYTTGIDVTPFFTGIDNYVARGTEDVNGLAAERYDGAIGSELMTELFIQTEMLEQLGLADTSAEQLADICDEIGSIDVSLWIDPDTYLPQKMSIDMTEVMRRTMSLSEDTDIGDQIKSAVLTYVNSQYNSLTPFEIPEEARNLD